MGFEEDARAALLAVTAGAAARTGGLTKNPQAFFEHVEQIGRRLANLKVLPADVSRALQLYDGLIEPMLETAPENDRANLRWVRDQLQFCILLTLNNAYYEVRESETQVFLDLFHAELEAHQIDALLKRFLETMVTFSRAAAGCMYLLDDDKGQWRLAARTGYEEVEGVPLIPASAASRRRLAKPLFLEARAEQKLLLDQSWPSIFASSWSLPLIRDGQLAGVVQLGFEERTKWLARELEVLFAAGERCLIAAEKAQLVEDLEKRQRQLRQLAARMLQIEEMERRKISRELHDDAGQSLVVIRLQMEMVENALEPQSEQRTRLAEARELTEKTIVSIRRLIAELSPTVLEQLGLPAALRQLVNRFRLDNGVSARLTVGKLPELGRDFSLVVYRTAQQCLSYIAKHSHADHVNIFLNTSDGLLRLLIEEDGVGFDSGATADRSDSLGLVALRERVALLGGEFGISTKPEEENQVKLTVSGSVLEIHIPIPIEK